jgi:starvation-inducible outer membrane lipoprotein
MMKAQTQAMLGLALVTLGLFVAGCSQPPQPEAGNTPATRPTANATSTAPGTQAGLQTVSLKVAGMT